MKSGVENDMVRVMAQQVKVYEASSDCLQILSRFWEISNCKFRFNLVLEVLIASKRLSSIQNENSLPVLLQSSRA